MSARDFFAKAKEVLLGCSPFIMPDDSAIEEGHYLLLMWSEVEAMPICHPPELQESPITSRRPSSRKAGLNKNRPQSGRSENTRALTRARDNICRISGTEPGFLGARRKWNYAGFQCCHIVPLAYVEHVSSWPEFVKPELRPLVNTHKRADKAYNCLLLRSDIHDQMDEYQFSFRPPSAGERKRSIVRFEKGGASSLPKDGSFDCLRDAAPVDQADDVWLKYGGSGSGPYDASVALKEGLLDAHWHISVLVNVPGYGRG
ncbi:hypothetical protein VKT23_008402 [Stygiomarasmius scandens]|uniref:HNH nuclease domain-containing protein n=1 Tax=Marasmiellus scandens TaxID=2682957 RepID=A0ABR1JJA3_9AGAR